ncbi:MAG: MBL fold metallo-hydrolase [Bdellovibrionota bacterium]
MIKIQFLGAKDTVTGSRTLLRFNGKVWLIDCGLFQGPKEVRDRNWEKFDISPHEIDGIILTHAHLDHSGYLPRICSQGYNGPIYMTNGTADLLEILLNDAAKLEEEQANYANRSRYSNHYPAKPLFTSRDVDKCLQLRKSEKRHEWIALDASLSVRFLNAGHIVGASMAQFAVNLGSITRLLTFSGDVGHERSFTLRAPEPIIETDILVLESTYGNRLHPRNSILKELAEVINRTIGRGGVLIIPAFAVGRAQEVVYLIKLLEEKGMIAKVPVLLDSPMANAATNIFLNHPEDQNIDTGFLNSEMPFRPAKFEMISSVDDSMLACMQNDPAIVISASGMLSGGRILHHVKHRIENEKNTILFSGFQAEGTKGRYLQEALENGADTIRIHHEEKRIEAEIVTLDSLSSHGDYQDLLEWLSKIRKFPKHIILNHGEIIAQESFRDKIKSRFDVDVRLASEEEIFRFWQ